jgi:erythromycin esterase-like protein
MAQLDRQSWAAVELLRANVESFPSIEEAGDTLAQTFDSFGSSKVILIGDASHGTSEFYVARAEITKYMIEKHGFNIVATEADWPDAEAVDRYVRYRPRPKVGSRDGAKEEEPFVRGDDEEETPFMRFPTWMWRNLEVQDFVEWLRRFNKGTDMHDAVGYYGLDLYSLGTSMRAVIRYLDGVDKEMADVARERYGRLMGWAENPHEYGLKTLVSGFKGYERDVVDMLSRLLSKRLEYSAAHRDGVEFHSGEQNARLVKGKL